MYKVFSACFVALILFFLATTPLSAASVLDVVISEVAWSGTGASSSDEWMELYNNTSSSIDLTGWTLASADGSPSVIFSNKTIAANGYFLLERTADTTISNISADLTYSGALNDSGEILQLKDASSTLIDSANGDAGAWPAGTGGSGTPVRASMERKNLTQADTDSNWVSNDGVTRNGTDASGNNINGTPKLANSGGYVPTPTPSPTPTGSPNASPSPSPSSSLSPTSAASPSPSPSPTPTKKPSPKPTPSPSSPVGGPLGVNPSPEEVVLAAATSQPLASPTPTSEATTSGLPSGIFGKNLLAFVLSGLGIGFLALAGFSYFKGKTPGQENF